MTAQPVLPEPDPRTHKGYGALVRDWLTTEARAAFGSPRPQPVPVALPKHAISMGAPALSTHDLQDTGVEWAMNELAPQTVPALDAIVKDVCTRLKKRFLTIDRQRKEDVARIRHLESLVQEREREVDALRGQVRRNIERLDDIAAHNDRIANTITPVVLSVDALLNLARHAPAILTLVEGQ